MSASTAPVRNATSEGYIIAPGSPNVPPRPRMRTLFAPLALLPSGWARDVQIEIDGHGNIAEVVPGALPGRAEHTGGALIPGMPNLHSHAFQRALAGRAERRAAPGEDFWSWRSVMYRFVDRIGPAECHAIAAQLYLELLRGGYTSVAEFHYLHHDPEGQPYAEPAELAIAHLRAARETGIAITLLPVLYGFGGFGGQPLAGAQRRFAGTPERLMRVLESLRRHYLTERDIRLGVAPHSLRAVTPEMLAEMIAGIDDFDPTAPIHMHVAEQPREVEEANWVLGARPIEWLIKNTALGPRWCLVHCTQASTDELYALAATRAIAGLCPTTEANLGDGVFGFDAFFEADGKWGIGSDSHVSRSAVEELRLLEYTQRLVHQRRDVAASDEHPSVGEQLWLSALGGGATALGRRTGAIEPGMRADLVVLDTGAVDCAGISAAGLLDAFVFSAGDRLIKHVAVSGRWVIRDGRHRDEEAIGARYRQAVARLAAVG
jgi:formimidoylglutamate deiminase